MSGSSIQEINLPFKIWISLRAEVNVRGTAVAFT
jgi:hypothetical protein